MLHVCRWCPRTVFVFSSAWIVARLPTCLCLLCFLFAPIVSQLCPARMTRGTVTHCPTCFLSLRPAPRFTVVNSQAAPGTCVASNFTTSAMQTPSPPRNIFPIALGSSWATVLWSPPTSDGGSPVLGYAVTWAVLPVGTPTVGAGLEAVEGSLAHDVSWDGMGC